MVFLYLGNHLGNFRKKRDLLQFNPNDSGDTPYRIKRAVKESGLSLQQICDQIKPSYGAELTVSALSHSINRGTLSLNRALQILAVCGVGEVEIVGGKK